jgi:hypothetical protein
MRQHCAHKPLTTTKRLRPGGRSRWSIMVRILVRILVRHQGLEPRTR